MPQKRFTIGITLAGDYSAGTTYKFLARVYDPVTGCSYLSKRENNLGHPVTDSNWWQMDSDGGVILGPYTRDEYDALVAGGLIDDRMYYAIVDN